MCESRRDDKTERVGRAFAKLATLELSFLEFTHFLTVKVHLTPVDKG